MLCATLADDDEKLKDLGAHMNIYVGNLSYEVSDKDLETAFTPYGQIESARIVMDRETNRARGFGFVEMPNKAEAQAAIVALNGKDLKGRTITVNEARPKTDSGNRFSRPSGGGGGGRGRY